MKQDMKQLLLGLKILGLAGLICTIFIGALVVFVGPIAVGFLENQSAATRALGRAFAIAVGVGAVWAVANYIMRGRTDGK